MRHAVLAAALAALVASPAALARGGAHSGSHAGLQASRSHSGHPTHVVRNAQRRRADFGAKRDARGRIARDPHAKEAFRRTHPCPSTGKKYGACPGYVVDHIRALKHGGADDPSNMQWQTRAAAKAKDRWE